MARAKETIALEKLKEIGKCNLKEPNSSNYLCDDVAVVVAKHHEFLLAIAPHTKRLNPSSVSIMAKDLFQLSGREAQQFGEAMSHAYGHCMRAGGKAPTGTKLTAEIYSVYVAHTKKVKSEEKPKAKREIEPEATASSSKAAKLELSSSPPKRFLEKCLSSPSQIDKLYGVQSFTAVKVIHMRAWGIHSHTGHPEQCVLSSRNATGGIVSASLRIH